MKKIVLVLFFVLTACLLFAGGANETDKEAEELHMFVAWELPEVLIEEFEAETGIDVQMEVITGLDDYKQARNARIASGEDVDIITTFGEEREEFMRKGYYEDLSGEPFLDRLIPGFHSAVASYAGDVVPGVSFEIIMLNVWYNKTKFAELGLAVPENYQDFIALCDKIVAAGETPLVQGGKDQWPYEQELWVCIGNLPVDSPDWKEQLRSGSLKWNEGYLLERFRRAQEELWQDGYHIPNHAGISYDQAFMLFAKQEALMWIMGSWATEVMLGAGVTPEFEIGAFAPPCNDAGTKGALNMGSDARLYSVLKGSKNIENAKKFFEFMTRKDIATRFANMNKTLSTIKGVEAKSLPAYADFAKILSGDRIAVPFLSVTPEVVLAKSDTIQATALKNMTYQEITDAWQAAQEADNAAGY